MLASAVVVENKSNQLEFLHRMSYHPSSSLQLCRQASAHAMAFLSLPNELIAKILDNVHPRDIIRSQMTCRTIRDLVQDSVCLQYRIDLFSACMMEGDRRGLSTGDCRRALQLREQAWHELGWRKKIDVDLPDFASVRSFVQLGGGILFIFDVRLANFRAARSVLFFRLSMIRRHSPSNWEEFDFESHVERFAIDISQDLLVLRQVDMGFERTTYRLHFRTLSINHARLARSDLYLQARYVCATLWW